MRFCGPASDSFIRRYCSNTGSANDIVLGYFVGGELRGAGELKLHHDGVFRMGAEVALSVETPYQGRGVGTRLLRRLTVLARNRGVGKIHMLCLRENAGMQTIASKLGVESQIHEYDVEGTAHLRWASHLTLAEEAMADGYEVLRLVLGLDRAP
jgi:GNAT superfamily N-acetyltransferase